jgi:hypothetical protein
MGHPAFVAGVAKTMVGRCASVKNQMDWLRAAGFEDTDCRDEGPRPDLRRLRSRRPRDAHLEQQP